jgi:hypothetical protein
MGSSLAYGKEEWLQINLPCVVLFRYNMRVYPKVSGLAAWSENCKWCSYLPLGTIVSVFCESV